MRSTRRSICALFFLVVLSLLMVRPALTQGGENNPGVIPPHAKYRGLTYGQWQSRYWQAMFEMPVVDGKHPLLSFGAFGGDDGVVYLSPSSGVAGSRIVDVTIPAGTPLFLPVRMFVEISVVELPYYGLPPVQGDVESYLRQASNDWLNTYASGYAASIDGRAVKNIDAYRSESPLFDFGPLPENNILQFFGMYAPAGTTSSSVAVGPFLLLTPLSVGQHEVRVSATAYDFNPSGDWCETVFRITVVPNKK